MSHVISVESLTDGGRAALERLILSLADSKRLMGIRYSDWVLGAPSLETGIATSSMTQDEWGHARLLYAMLKHLDIDPTQVEHDRSAEAYANLSVLDQPFDDWAALVAAMVIADGALSVALCAFSEGTFEPARVRVPKMLAEESFHVSLGVAWYGRLSAASDEARSLLRAATDRQLPVVLAWLGSDDAASRELVALGVMPSAEALTTAFKASVRDVLADGDVDVDAIEAASDWDAARGRASGHPDDDSVDRACGSKNRALLVE
jgi:phenylacetate-CoA oxygenase PaaI subunit